MNDYTIHDIPDMWLCGAVTYRMRVLKMEPKAALDDAAAWWTEQERLERIAKEEIERVKEEGR